MESGHDGSPGEKGPARGCGGNFVSKCANLAGAEEPRISECEKRSGSNERGRNSDADAETPKSKVGYPDGNENAGGMLR